MTYEEETDHLNVVLLFDPLYLILCVQPAIEFQRTFRGTQLFSLVHLKYKKYIARACPAAMIRNANKTYKKRLCVQQHPLHRLRLSRSSSKSCVRSEETIVEFRIPDIFGLILLNLCFSIVSKTITVSCSHFTLWYFLTQECQ